MRVIHSSIKISQQNPLQRSTDGIGEIFSRVRLHLDLLHVCVCLCMCFIKLFSTVRVCFGDGVTAEVESACCLAIRQFPQASGFPHDESGCIQITKLKWPKFDPIFISDCVDIKIWYLFFFFFFFQIRNEPLSYIVLDLTPNPISQYEWDRNSSAFPKRTCISPPSYGNHPTAVTPSADG